MQINIENRRRSSAGITSRNPGAVIIDVTSKGNEPWVQFSPFYPHGGIPVPFTTDTVSCCVEGIWQALKVFEGSDVDVNKLAITSMKGLKRTVRNNGPVVGHRQGVGGLELLDYVTARHKIFLPTYRWVLENKVQAALEELRGFAEGPGLVLLDFTVNGDVSDISSPLSHAALIGHYLQGSWPAGD